VFISVIVAKKLEKEMTKDLKRQRGIIENLFMKIKENRKKGR